MAGALSHLRVLDLSRILAGPWCSQILADLGAEVIKVERPGVGDDTRSWGPPYLKRADGRDTSESAYYLCANRNKKSVTVDMTQPTGQSLLKQLAARSDVVIENFKVGGLKRYGLGYESLSRDNVGLIYCSVTGFGQDGPYAPRPGYDFLIQGMGGLMSLTGRKEGEDGAGPQKVGVALTDILTGLYATVAILAALAHREKSGQGQYIDMALLDVQVGCLANQAMNFLTTGVPPARLGNAHPNIVPYQDFPTADGEMILAAGNDAQFASLCRILGHPEWSRMPEFATNQARVTNRNELIPLLRGATVKRSTRKWIRMLEQANVPCGPINSLADVFDDPQVKVRGMKLEMSHPLTGAVSLVANPIRLSTTPVEYRLPPPLLGQHTTEVLRDLLGMDERLIDDLSRRNII